MKKILNIIVEPLKMVSNRNIAEKISVLFTKKKYLVYLTALLITLVAIFFIHVYPNL